MPMGNCRSSANSTTITVSALPTCPGRFEARLGDQVLGASSRQPFLDGARRLIEIGHDPAARLVMRHAGSEIEALRSTIGAAARLTVREDEKRGPELVRYKAFLHADIAPPIAPEKDPAKSTPSPKPTRNGGPQ
jgi:hypothetical protein